MNKISDKLVSWASILEPNTLEQAQMTSRLPFVTPHVALMPDAHLGLGSTVGSVIPTTGAVVPSSVGVDIGCGMCAAKLSYKRNDLAGKDLSILRHSIERSIPLSVGGNNRVITESAAVRIKSLEDAANYRIIFYNDLVDWRKQLGSLGSGNHFCEVVYDEEDNIWLFLHSGSRGVGNKIGMHHIGVAQALCKKMFIELPDKDLAYLVEDTPEFDRYIEDLHWAQMFALLNREEMMDRAIKDVGHFMGNLGVKEVERINTHHNYTQKEHHMGRDLWITRKGAISAQEGQLGLIPGSMGTGSFVVIGKGNKPSFCSAPHGAGRKFSRTEARKQFTVEDMKKVMKGIEYREEEVLLDEIPGAYKPIETVMDDAKELVDIVHKFTQLINVKGD